MSTRWYPKYVVGNPQLRIFLPNFWLKLVKPEVKQPPNVVQFHCSMEMSKYDIKNYLEKIYKIPVVKVNTRVAMGKFKKNQLQYVVKEDDVKVAYVVMPKGHTFEFPNLFEKSEAKHDDDRNKKDVDVAQEKLKSYIKKCNEERPGVPAWFSL